MKKKNKYKVCVIGFRTLEPTLLKEYFDKITKLLLHIISENPTKEVIVISTLADGVDRLIVRAALKIGLRYNILLPMKREHYKKDFDDESYKEFNSMLINSRGCNVIPLHAKSTELSIADYNLYRDYQYHNVVFKLVEISDSVFFIFNDMFNEKIEAVLEIKEYAKKLNKLCYYID